jgi:gliding motility-associated protein GldM
MAGGKQSPRQRMINLMYLVLTAMLALQVSSSIMDKFIFLNNSLENSVDNSKKASENALVALKKKVEQEGNTAEGQRSVQRAEDLKKKTSIVLSEIDKIKQNLVEKAGEGKDKNGVLKNPKEETKVEAMMIGPVGSRSGKAYDLENKLNGYVAYLNKEFKDLNMPTFEDLAFGNKNQAIYKEDRIQRDKDFANANFGQTPVVAALAILTQKQAEVIKYEQAVLKELGAGDISKDIKFDKITAMASADANIVAAGTEYRAIMFVSATSSKAGARMTYNGSAIKVNADGVGEVKFTATGRGDQRWKGIITFPVKGKDTTFTFDKEYTVVEPVLIVSSQSKFPLYQNCANALETSVPALGPSYKPSFSVNNGSAIPGGRVGDVTIFPSNVGTCVLQVSSGGKNVGQVEFRVNPVPPPSVVLVNNAGGVIQLKDPIPPSRYRVMAKPDETFANTLPKEANYRVTGVNYTLFRGGRSVGTKSSPDGSIDLISMGTRPGDGVQITVSNVQRINSRQQAEPAKVTQPYIGFFLR